jgi:coenzyme Q-binding protein COQ10
VPSHSEQRALPYPPERLFDLVADVERYPDFLPWCVASRILSRTETDLRAELAIGFKGIRERFVSHVTLDRPDLRIDVTYEDGPFKFLENHWKFEDRGEAGCLLDFYVDFEFKSRLLAMLIGPLFDDAVRRMVQAFEDRAAALHDTAPS